MSAICCGVTFVGMCGGSERLRIEALRQQIKASADVSTIPPLPDLEAMRNRILKDLKLGKQAPGYRAAAKALDRFISELLTPD